MNLLIVATNSGTIASRNLVQINATNIKNMDSTAGNVNINAGHTFTQTGSNVRTPAGNIDIAAKSVAINEARETGSQSTEQKFKQSGLTVAITSPVLSAVQMASSQINAAGNTSSGRMQALAGANAAFNLKQGADAIAAGQAKEGGNAAGIAGGIGIGASIGASSSQSKQQSSADSAKGSNLNAGGNVTIQATGAGANSNITVQGSSIEAGKATTLKADDQVNIVAAQNTTQEGSQSSNKSGSVGVAIQLGAGFSGSVNVGQTKVNSDYLSVGEQSAKIVARDSKDNDKIINLSDDDLRKLAAENPEVLNQLIAGIGKTDVPIVVKDSSAQNMTGSSIQDLNNPTDRAAIAKESDMGYVNINGQARVFVQTGMDNTRQDAGVSAQALSKVLGGVNTGYINNGTEGLTGDVGEYLPNSLSKKDVLNEYTYRTLNAQGPTLIATHSAGNEDAKKALQAGAMYGHTYDNLSFVSLGSPVSNSVMKNSVTNAGANYLGQVNDWRDPVTNPKLWVAGTATLAVGGLAAGVALAPVTGGGSLYGYFSALIGGGIGGGIGVGSLNAYHPFEQYITKPQSQSIMFDWLKSNPRGK